METNSINVPHEDYQSLLGAYALDATSEEEQRQIEAHLRTCATCREELRQLRLAVGELALLADEVEPPDRLRDRIHDAARRNPQRRQLDKLSAPRPIRSFHWPASWLVAAVLLLAVIGLLVWNLQLQQREGTAPIETIALQAQGVSGTVSGQLIYLREQQIGVLKTESLPPLEPGQVYQMWLIKDGTPVGAGVFTSPVGEQAVAVDLQTFQAFALTVEPGPDGSVQPTSTPFAVARIAGS